MIFHDIIKPEKFHVGRKCKIITMGLTVIISKINYDSIVVDVRPYEGVAEFNV